MFRSICLATLLALTAPSRAAPGVVTGKVMLATGSTPIPIENVWVYAELATPPPASLGKNHRTTIDQVHETFVPGIVVIPVGSTVAFPNRDATEHSVFSPQSRGWFGFELGRYFTSSTGRSYTFKSTGEFDIFCDLHEKMSATIKVIPSLHVARVASDGTYQLAVPPGQYWIRAWTPHSKEVRSEPLAITAGATVPVRELYLQKGPAPTSHSRQNGASYDYKGP